MIHGHTGGLSRAILTTILVAGTTVPAYAATRSWENPAGGDFSEPTNWSVDAVPGENDLALFDTSTTGQVIPVTLSESITNENLYVGNPSEPEVDLTLNFDLNGFDYTTTRDDAGAGFVVGRRNSDVTMNISGGGQVTVERFDAGYASSGKGTLSISGEGTSLTSSASENRIGSAGTAVLEVAEGASLTASGTLLFGRNVQGAGVFRDGATVSAGSIELGWAGQGALSISGGAVADVSGDFVATSDSDLTVELDEVSASAAPVITVGGALSLDSTSQLTLSLAEEADVVMHDVYNLIEYEGTLTGSFSNYTEGEIFSMDGHEFEFSYGSGEQSAVSLTVIPEPSALTLMGGGLLLLWHRRRQAGRGSAFGDDERRGNG